MGFAGIKWRHLQLVTASNPTPRTMQEHRNFLNYLLISTSLASAALSSLENEKQVQWYTTDLKRQSFELGYIPSISGKNIDYMRSVDYYSEIIEIARNNNVGRLCSFVGVLIYFVLNIPRKMLATSTICYVIISW